MKSMKSQFVTIAIATIIALNDAAISGRQTLSGPKVSSNNSIDYFHQRWNNNNSNNNKLALTKTSLRFLPIPAQSILDARPVQSLNVRGGGGPSRSQRYAAPTAFVRNVANIRINKSTLDSVVLANLEITSRVTPLSVAELVKQKVNDYHRRNNIHTSHDKGLLKSSRQTTAAFIRPGQKRRRSEAIFALSAAIFFAGTHLETAWSNASPKLLQWWQDGRSERGLFRIDTWKQSSEDRSILQEAWDRQFKTKQIQLAIGCTAGLVVAPAITVVGGVTVMLATATYIAAELNRRLPKGSKRRMFRNKVRTTFRTICDNVDVGLEKCRSEIINVFQQPHKLTQNLVLRALRDDVWIPQSVQRGLIVGIILGLASSLN